MILYIMNDFSVPETCITEYDEESVITNAFKFLDPKLKDGVYCFHAQKICLYEDVMHDITEFLGAVSTSLEWFYFGHPDEVYFQVYVRI